MFSHDFSTHALGYDVVKEEIHVKTPKKSIFKEIYDQFRRLEHHRCHEIKNKFNSFLKIKIELLNVHSICVHLMMG